MSASDPFATIEGQRIVLQTTALKVDIQTPETPSAERHRLWRESLLTGVALTLLSVAFTVSLWFAFLATGTDADTRKAAVGIVLTLIGALGGFLGGRATK